jgi:hypothetical protein
VTETDNSEPQVKLREVTAAFNHYRVSARAIWNTAFWPDPDLRDWDSVDQFDAIQRLLFTELILAKLGKEWPLEKIFRQALPFFRIVPSSQEVPIMIQNPRPEAASGYWDHPLKTIKRAQAELLFLDYFDWNRMDYLDLRYYRVQISRFDAHSDLIGREALIDCQNAAVYVRED